MTEDLRSRIGKFTISQGLLADTPDELLMQLFEGMVVLRTTDNICDQETEYIAVSQAFEPTYKGYEVPMYLATCTRTEEGTTLISWGKV